MDLRAVADAFWLVAMLAAFILSLWIGLRPLREAFIDRAVLESAPAQVQLTHLSD
jgi:hypothetical protein